MSVEADLKAYADLLLKWNAVQNLVSRETVAELWPRHIEDSLQLMEYLRETDRELIDLGSGGGFPAIPLAIASRGMERRFTLLEPVAKKASFLRLVARELALPVTVHSLRAEEFDSRETFDVLTSRALASLARLFEISGPLVGAQTRLLLHKGAQYRREIDEAAQLFSFDVLVHPSRTSAESAVLEISNLRSKSAH